VSQLCERLATIEDGPGTTVLDNSVVLLASPLSILGNYARQLPCVLVGGGGGRLRTDQHVVFPSDRPLRDVYTTIIDELFHVGVGSFGDHVDGVGAEIVSEILV
jgi:hypothetical protein